MSDESKTGVPATPELYKQFKKHTPDASDMTYDNFVPLWQALEYRDQVTLAEKYRKGSIPEEADTITKSIRRLIEEGERANAHRASNQQRQFPGR